MQKNIIKLIYLAIFSPVVTVPDLAFATIGLDLGPSRTPTGRLSNMDNKHNLSFNANHPGPKAADPLTGGTTEICVFCHTPHAADADTPLWNRPDPDSSVFELYTNPLAIAGTLPGSNLDAPTRTMYSTSVEYPNGSSRLCMSCHDGITAIGALVDNTTIAMLAGNDKVSTIVDLKTAHPISFVYTQTIIDNDINPFRGGAYQMPSTADAVDTPLDGMSRMQCTTCHDPHYDAQMDDATLPPFWRQKRVSSAAGVDPYDDVCNACHVGIVTQTNHVFPTP